MSTESLDDLLQNADQLFDENKFHEVVDILKKHPVNVGIFFFFDYSVEFDRPNK